MVVDDDERISFRTEGASDSSEDGLNLVLAWRDGPIACWWTVLRFNSAEALDLLYLQYFSRDTRSRKGIRIKALKLKVAAEVEVSSFGRYHHLGKDLRQQQNDSKTRSFGGFRHYQSECHLGFIAFKRAAVLQELRLVVLSHTHSRQNHNLCRTAFVRITRQCMFPHQVLHESFSSARSIGV